MNFDDSDFILSLRVDVIHYFFSAVAYRTHGNDHFCRVRCAVVIERLIVSTDQSIYFIHVLRDYVWECIIFPIDRFSVLEVCFRLLGRSHKMRMLRIESTCSVCIHRSLVYHALQYIIVPDLDLLLLVGCSESVKEVQCRHAR